MSIKADRWIRHMAREHGMIEPFTDQQVRGGVISYGVSSYGYDMRVANEFKVFTNVYNVVVDPKTFSPQSFVDIQADYCDIPPNSFALARSVEYFRIPRNILCIVMGKSSYARCFRGDTRVALVDGTSLALEEMATRAEQGEMFWGYSIGQYGRIIVTLLDNPRYIGRDSLLEIELDNGAVIHCTPDHDVMLRDGQMRAAGELTPGTALMPLYRDVFREYEGVFQPLSGNFTPTHRLADEWNIRNGMYADVPNTHRHHIDHERRNNMPWNIQRVPAHEHLSYHNAAFYHSADFDPQAHSAAIRDALAQLRQEPEWVAQFQAVQQKRVQDFWTEPHYQQIREQLLQQHRAYWAVEQHREQQRQRQQAYWDDAARRQARAAFSRETWARDDGSRREQQRDIARMIRLRPETTADVVRDALDQTGSIHGAARLLDCDRSVFRRFPEVLAAFRGRANKNHRIVAVRSLPGDHDVYCLTVPEAGNFALEAGVFTSNCGIIINVTPLEPAWEGHITIEISNTTPLPARVYANEGIGQILFFEGDEPCEVSYADKQGKYQQQRGITLPRVEPEQGAS